MGNMWGALLLSTACQGLLSPWAILGISAVLSSVCGILILFGNGEKKHRREAVLRSVCHPKLQQCQPQMWALVVSLCVLLWWKPNPVSWWLRLTSFMQHHLGGGLLREILPLVLQTFDQHCCTRSLLAISTLQGLHFNRDETESCNSSCLWCEWVNHGKTWEETSATIWEQTNKLDIYLPRESGQNLRFFSCY